MVRLPTGLHKRRAWCLANLLRQRDVPSESEYVGNQHKDGSRIVESEVQSKAA